MIRPYSSFQCSASFIDTIYAITYGRDLLEQPLTLAMTDSAYRLSLDIDDFRQSRVEFQSQTHNELIDGEICIRIDKIAMTANSISYGFAGKSGLIRYLDIYPASEGYANLPCWGYGDIVQSNHQHITVGDRINGFLPIASHIKKMPGDVSHADLPIPEHVELLCHRFITNTPLPNPSRLCSGLKRPSCSSGLYLGRHS